MSDKRTCHVPPRVKAKIDRQNFIQKKVGTWLKENVNPSCHSLSDESDDCEGRKEQRYPTLHSPNGGRPVPNDTDTSERSSRSAAGNWPQNDCGYKYFRAEKMVNFPSRFVFNRRSFRNGIQSKDMFNAIRREFLEGHLEDGVLSERATKLEGENDGEPYNAKLIWQIRVEKCRVIQNGLLIYPHDGYPGSSYFGQDLFGIYRPAPLPAASRSDINVFDVYIDEIGPNARNRLVLYLGHNLSCDWEYAEEVCFAAFIEDMIQFVRVFPRLTTLAREEEVCQKLSEFRILADQPSMSRKESRRKKEVYSPMATFWIQSRSLPHLLNLFWPKELLVFSHTQGGRFHSKYHDEAAASIKELVFKMVVDLREIVSTLEKGPLKKISDDCWRALEKSCHVNLSHYNYYSRLRKIYDTVLSKVVSMRMAKNHGVTLTARQILKLGFKTYQTDVAEISREYKACWKDCWTSDDSEDEINKYEEDGGVYSFNFTERTKRAYTRRRKEVVAEIFGSEDETIEGIQSFIGVDEGTSGDSPRSVGTDSRKGDASNINNGSKKAIFANVRGPHWKKRKIDEKRKNHDATSSNGSNSPEYSLQEHTVSLGASPPKSKGVVQNLQDKE